MVVRYRIRRFITSYTCIDTEATVRLLKIWEDGGLLYGYKDRFNIVSIAKDDILSIEEV